MTKRKRGIPIYFMVSEEEKNLIEEKMLQYGTKNFSAYARKMLINGNVIKYDFRELKELTAQLGKIGSNVNQIAKRANTNRFVYKEDIENVLRKLHEIKLLVNDKVGKLIDKSKKV